MPSSLITVDATDQVYSSFACEGLSVGSSGVIFGELVTSASTRPDSLCAVPPLLVSVIAFTIKNIIFAVIKSIRLGEII